MRTLRPPFVLLANHVNFWDPFFIAFAFSHPIHFIAADGNFRSRLMRTFMRAAGTVPKAKVRTDMDTIRTLRTLVSGGHAVGFFPEGQRTWDGAGRPFLPGTEKLIRILGVPVVAVRLKGAYLSFPRWARTVRRGRLEIEPRLVCTAGDLARISRQDLGERLDASLRFDENLWRAESGLRFRGRHRAERAETVLFLCDRCGAWDTLRSHENTLRCSACGTETWFSSSGLLYRSPALPSPQHISDWNNLQIRELHHRLKNDPEGSSGCPALPFSTPHAVLLTGYRTRPLRFRGVFQVELTREELRIGQDTTIPVREISGINVQFTHQLEFYAQRRLYVLRVTPPGPSAYRFEQTILACHYTG